MPANHPHEPIWTTPPPYPLHHQHGPSLDGQRLPSHTAVYIYHASGTNPTTSCSLHHIRRRQMGHRQRRLHHCFPETTRPHQPPWISRHRKRHSITFLRHSTTLRPSAYRKSPLIEPNPTQNGDQHPSSTQSMTGAYYLPTAQHLFSQSLAISRSNSTYSSHS
jgi:hypothetical protein